MEKKPLELIEGKIKYNKPHKFENKKWLNKERKWVYFDDISFNSLAIDINKNLDKYAELENNVSILGSGVYIIENFYIGKTNNIINRVTSHIIEIFYEEYGCKNYFNKEKCEKIREVLSQRKLKVKIIDSDINRERIYIDELKGVLDLTNHTGVKTKEVKLNKYEVKERKKILKEIEVTINSIIEKEKF